MPPPERALSAPLVRIFTLACQTLGEWRLRDYNFRVRRLDGNPVPVVRTQGSSLVSTTAHLDWGAGILPADGLKMRVGCPRPDYAFPLWCAVVLVPCRFRFNQSGPVYQGPGPLPRCLVRQMKEN